VHAKRMLNREEKVYSIKLQVKIFRLIFSEFVGILLVDTLLLLWSEVTFSVVADSTPNTSFFNVQNAVLTRDDAKYVYVGEDEPLPSVIRPSGSLIPLACPRQCFGCLGRRDCLERASEEQ
jgi:hypothetical protein